MLTRTPALLALTLAACTTQQSFEAGLAPSELLPRGDPRWKNCAVMLEPTPDPKLRAGSLVRAKPLQYACNTPPPATGPQQAVSIGAGITMLHWPGKPTVVNQIIQECFQQVPAAVQLGKALKQHKYVIVYGDGYRMSEATWAALPSDVQQWMIWNAALVQACTELRPVRMTVNIRDDAGRAFHRQRVSTEFKCRPRGFRLASDDTWYRC